MTEELHRLWDVVLKIAASIAAIITFLVGVSRFSEERRAVMQAATVAESRTRERTFQQELFKRDLEVYASILEVASNLAVPEEEGLEGTAREFERLYWANITVGESDAVTLAMDELRHAIRYYRQGFVEVGTTKPEDQLKLRSHELSEAIRSEIRDRINGLTTVE